MQKYCDCLFFDYADFKNNLIGCKCLCCNKNHQHIIDKQLKKRFFNTYKFSNHNNNKFILLLRKFTKFISPCEYIDDWEKFNETSLPEKEDFYSLLNMEDITDADNAHARIVCKDFEIVNFGEYHDWPVQIDTLLLADVFKIFRNMCFKIQKLGPAKLLSAPRLAWQATFLKK